MYSLDILTILYKEEALFKPPLCICNAKKTIYRVAKY